jgi:hypothetical protein
MPLACFAIRVTPKAPTPCQRATFHNLLPDNEKHHARPQPNLLQTRVHIAWEAVPQHMANEVVI